MKSEIRSLTGLRGVAAVWVMLGHYLGESPANETVRFVVSHGYIAVDVFMVLSGFVLALTYEAQFQWPPVERAFTRFLWHRLARIYPLYALTSVLCAVMAWVGLPIWGAPALSVGSISANLSMVQSWLPSLGSLNATGWSISTEWAANLLFPVFVVLLLRISIRWSVVVAVGAFALLAHAAFMTGNAGEGDYAAGALDWYIFPQSLTRCITEFMLGMICWRLRDKFPWLGYTTVLLALVSASLVLTVFTMLDIVLVILVCGLVIGLSLEKSCVATALGSPVLRWFGTISFGIYLIQLPVLALRPGLEATLTRIGVPAADDVATGLGMLMVVGLSALSFTYFERPVQRSMRGMFSRRAAAVVLAGAFAMGIDTASARADEQTAPWWQERHAVKRDEARRGNIDLVLMGDSITHNYETSEPRPWHDFRPVWNRFYANRHTLNLGFSGDTTTNLLWRIRNGEIDAITPAAVVILIGINDIGLGATAAETVTGIDAIVAEVRRRLPRAALVLLGVLPSQCDQKTTATTLAVNAALEAHYGGGAVDNVTYVDVSPVFMRDGVLDTSLFYDPLLTPPEPPLHPSPEGQRRMAAAIEPVVARLMGDMVHGQ